MFLASGKPEERITRAIKPRKLPSEDGKECNTISFTKNIKNTAARVKLQSSIKLQSAQSVAHLLPQEAESLSKSAHSVFVELRRAYKDDFGVLQQRELYKQIERSQRLEISLQEKFIKFIEGYISDSQKEFKSLDSVNKLLHLSDRLLTALPHYPSNCELSLLVPLALNYRNSPEKFSNFINQHRALTTSIYYEDLRVPLRVMVKIGIQSGECPIAIAKSLKELQTSKRFIEPENREQLIAFMRGLICNDWPISSSLMVIKDVLDRHQNTYKALELCSLSVSKSKAARRNPFDNSENLGISAALEYLAMGDVGLKEIETASKLYQKSDTSAYELNICAQKLFTLFEACRFSSKVNIDYICKRLDSALSKSGNPADLIDILLRNTVTSVDNLSARRLIEKIISANTIEDFKGNLAVLKNIHNADVPDLAPKRKSDLPLYEQQVDIFKQAMACFDTFREVRSSLPLFSSELRRLPDGHPSLLATFAYEVAKVSNLHCSDECYPGSGIIISNFNTDCLFELDKYCPESPYHRYLESPGISQSAIDDFLNSQIIITDSLMIISVPGSEKYRMGEDEICAVFFADNIENYGGNQCFLIPKQIVDEKFKDAAFDFMDLPSSCKRLVDLSDRNLYPEDFVLQAHLKKIPFFDIGAATNIGGLSNSRGVFPDSEVQASIRLESLLGLRERDPWGNTKKMQLLKYPQLFNDHSSLHQKLVRILDNFGQVYKIFENRYAAWKKGNTPHNLDCENEWAISIPSQHLGLRMLQAAYRWHFQSQQATRTGQKIELPTIEFWPLGSLHSGPVDGFKFDVRRMQLILPDETIQLPIISPDLAIEHNEELVDKFCFSAKSSTAWELNVRPHLENLMPVLNFSKT